MNGSCCIKSCGRKRRVHKVRMFAFPRANSLIGRIWREKCNIPQEIYYMRPRICHLHFDKKDVGNRYLKRTAIPKYFLNQISVDNADGNDQAANDDSVYDWKSLDEKQQRGKVAQKEPPKKVIVTTLLARCSNCDRKNELASCYELKCNSLINENYQLQLQLEEKSKLLKKAEQHSSEYQKTIGEVIHYKLKCEKLSEECAEYKDQAEDLLSDSLRNLERSKYYEKKCDALKEKYERIINKLEEQLKQQTELQRNCLPECSNNPEPNEQSRNINSLPESMPSSDLEKQSEKTCCMPEPMLSANSSDPALNANLITEPMQLDNQPNSEPSQNVVDAIKDDNDDVGLILKREIEDEMDNIKETDSEVDFNFNYDDALMSPSSVKQEEEFILE